MRSPWLLVLALAACDGPAAKPGAANSGVNSASAGPSGTAPKAEMPPHPAEPAAPVRPPPLPVGSATLAAHTQGAMRLRIWEVHPDADAGPKLAALLVTDSKLIAGMREAIGFDQKPKATGTCERCAAPVRIVFESPLGVDLGAVDLGCPGAAKGTGRYWQPASTTCGDLTLKDPAALGRLIEEARKKPASEGAQGLP